MEKRVYFLKFNKKILRMDLISFASGLIGVFLGIVSILALQPFWNSEKVSLWITVVAIFFDTTSFILVFLPFFLMYHLIRIKKTLIKQNMKLYRKDQFSISFDFISFASVLLVQVVNWSVLLFCYLNLMINFFHTKLQLLLLF